MAAEEVNRKRIKFKLQRAAAYIHLQLSVTLSHRPTLFKYEQIWTACNSLPNNPMLTLVDREGGRQERRKPEKGRERWQFIIKITWSQTEVFLFATKQRTQWTLLFSIGILLHQPVKPSVFGRADLAPQPPSQKEHHCGPSAEEVMQSCWCLLGI